MERTLELGTLVSDLPPRAWGEGAVLGGSAAESGDHSHELAPGKVLPDCCDPCLRARLLGFGSGSRRRSFGGSCRTCAQKA